MKATRFVPEISGGVLAKYVHSCAPRALHHALQAAGINPEIVKAQLPDVMKHFVPALSQAVNHGLHSEGGFLGAFDGSPLLAEVLSVSPQAAVPLHPLPGQNGTGPSFVPAPSPVIQQPVRPAYPPPPPGTAPAPMQPFQGQGIQNSDNPPSMTDF